MRNTPQFILVGLLLTALSVSTGLRGAPGLPAAYDLPPLPADDPANQFVRTQAEVLAAGRQVLAHYANKWAAAAGFLDVTKAPYLARGDDTVALQRALRDARDARLVVWLPAGTYLVRDTLQCVEGAMERRPSRDDPKADLAAVAMEPTFEDRLSAWDWPCVIRGAGGEKRAVIRLAPDARGFADPARPRPLLFIWARRWDPPHDLQGNISFNQMLISVDLDIRGHAGAIGVDLQGAQGTAVQDVRIEAEGAFAGLRGLSGSGGGTHQLTVHGGRYGVLAAGIGEYAKLTGSQPSPLLAAATLTGQSVASICYAGRGPFTVVGAKIQGRGIVCDGGAFLFNGAINLLDSTLEIDGGAAITTNRPVYVANTFTRGADPLVRFPDGTPAALPSAGWSQVREFAGAPAGPYPVWLDGKKQTALVADIVTAPAPPADLQSRHALPPLPVWGSPGVADAGAAPYSARGDNQTDDAPAIQRALDEHAVVFLPKGRYRLGRPLQLAPGRKLIGAGRSFTVLLPLPGSPAFADGAAPQPLVDVADTPEGDTAIALLQLNVPGPGASALRWRAGANSVVRDVNFRCGPSGGTRGPCVVVEGNGGGRWLNLFFSDAMTGSDYRQILVRGTRQPLAFYMFNPEHTRGEVMTEFIDTRNVTIYALKGETFVINHPERGTRPLLRVRDSAGFRLYGGGGIGGAAAGDQPQIYRFENSRDFLIANAGHQFHELYFAAPKTWSILSDVRDGHETATPGDEYFTLYRRK